MTEPQMETVTGLTLQQRRLLILMHTGSDRRSCLQWYSDGGMVCVVCGKHGASVLRGSGHDVTRCDRELRQILMFGCYLLARGIQPFKRIGEV